MRVIRHRPAAPAGRFLVCLAVVVVTSSSPGASRAELAEQRPAAKALYELGTAAYNHGDFDEAIAAFTRAHDLDPAPILLFNIAQAWRKKGENGKALFFYRQYVEADPKGENRDRAQEHIRQLENELPPAAAPVAIEQKSPPSPAVALAAPPMVNAESRNGLTPLTIETPAAERPAIYRRPWFWMVAGGLVVGAAAVVLATQLGGGGSGFDCGGTCTLGVVPVRGQ
jgi:tetratricopeptide (TPR) repeat protein